MKRAFFGVITALAALAATFAMPSSANAEEPTPLSRAESIMNLTYIEFATLPHDAPFEWSTDGCSFIGVPSYFTPACVQHDFGYRNFGGNWALKLDPTEERKDWIDERFLDEMYRICADTDRGAGCHTTAYVVYTGVQLGGDNAFF